MHALSVCSRNPPKYDMDYRTFKVPTQSFNACVCTCVGLYLLCKTEWLPFSWSGQVLWAPFFSFGRDLGAPFYEILETALIVISQNIFWQNWIVVFKVKVTAKFQNVNECLSR